VISDIAAWLFALFVIDPLQTQISERLEAANVPVAAVQQSRRCIASHAPRLVERAGTEPGWAIATAVGVATGWTAPAELLDPNDPNCLTLVRALKIENDQARDA